MYKYFIYIFYYKTFFFIIYFSTFIKYFSYFFYLIEVKKLTLELITQRTKNSNCNEIKTLNLWGKEFEDILILSKNPNSEICSLSTNKIYNTEVFENFKNLKELYLKTI